jgi:hypothetical protein
MHTSSHHSTTGLEKYEARQEIQEGGFKFQVQRL